jgi:hypothetical protein
MNIYFSFKSTGIESVQKKQMVLHKIQLWKQAQLKLNNFYSIAAFGFVSRDTYIRM